VILVWTPVHGKPPIVDHCLAAIAEHVPGPFVHLIGDDFTPDDAEADALCDLDGTAVVNSRGETVGERRVYHCRDLGVEGSPNLGLSMQYAWSVALTLEAEALLVIESDVLIHAGAVEAFQETVATVDRCGSVTCLFTEVDGNTISSFGGMTTEREFLGGIPLGSEIGSWDMSVPRYDRLLWSHNGCIWIPRSTLEQGRVFPDADFKLFYLDHALSYAIRSAGLDVIITDRAVAEHTRGAASTSKRWPDEARRTMVERTAYQQLYAKWRGRFM
jgi:GT2 family glycosyltransferase